MNVTRKYATAWRLLVVALVLLPWMSMFADSEEDARAKEKRRIEALITSVENLANAKFVRNGKEYSPASAAKFLRAKWERSEREIGTADEFIEKIATRSSTTGRPYAVRFSDGRQLPLAEFLRARTAR